MKILSNEQIGALYAATSGLCYGLVGYFGMNIINAGSSISNMMFWRFAASGASVFVVLLYLRPTLTGPKELIKTLLCGLAFYSLSSMAYIASGKIIGTGIAMVIFFIYPAFVVLFNWLLYRAPVSLRYYLALLLITIGLIFLGDIEDFTFNGPGMSFALVSAVLYAFYIIGSKRIKVEPMISTFMVSIGGMITSLIWALIEESFSVPNTMSLWLNILGFGIISTSIPILLLLKGLKYLSSEKAAMLSVLEPVFVVIFGIALLGEKIKNNEAIGIVILLLGASITLFFQRKKQNDIARVENS